MRIRNIPSDVLMHLFGKKTRDQILKQQFNTRLKNEVIILEVIPIRILHIRKNNYFDRLKQKKIPFDGINQKV